MSAYEEAWDAFRGVLTDKELDRLLTGIERETAHGCAEKQRAYGGPSITMAGNRMVPLDMITALIDPEVKGDAPQEEAQRGR